MAYTTNDVLDLPQVCAPCRIPTAVPWLLEAMIERTGFTLEGMDQTDDGFRHDEEPGHLMSGDVRSSPP